MFADFIKMAAKVAVIGLSMVVILAVLNGLAFPNIDFVAFGYAIGKGRAIMNYYAGGFAPLFNFALVLISIRYVAIPVTYMGLVGLRWILKINE